MLLVASLSGCATLPTSGPTGKQIEKAALASSADFPIKLVAIKTAGDVPQAPSDIPTVPLPDSVPPPTDQLGPGDVIEISIYEAGVTLFASSGSTGPAGQTALNPGVQVQKLPPSRIDDNGYIVVPYAGKLKVGGKTIGAAERLIRDSMRGMSQNPQVVVTLNQIITNSIIVGGEVAKPGRLILQTNRETLSDVVALAGGYRGNSRDLVLRVTRRSQIMDIRLNDLVENPQLDVRAYPGDRLTLISSPRSFSVLGASGRTEQIPFTNSRISVAEAMAAAGGANPALADPAAVFLFRYVTDADGKETPVVYHLNMMNTGTYFLAQRFAMRDKDVLYFGNAAANQPSKLLSLISQLFTPLVTVTAAVQTIQSTR